MKKFLSSLLLVFATMCALPAFADDLCKNLFDKNSTLSDETVWAYTEVSGIYQGNGSNLYGTHKIPVTAGKTYYRTGNHGAANFFWYADGTQGSIQNSDNAVTIPDGVIEWAFNIRTDSNRDTIMIVEGDSEPTTYQPYNPLCATCDGIVRESPNLFDIDAMFNGRSANYPKNTNGKLNIIAKDGSAWSSLINTDGITLPAGTYTLSTTSSNIKMNCKLASDMDHDLTSQTTITFTLNGEDTLICKIFAINDEYPVNSVEIQLERGSTATEYHPYGTTYCADAIKIATTAYNDAQFAPVEAALENAVTTIKDVVANTIVQADAIQNLQDTKQTMPDANGTNGTCPRFRQCLLIETDDGTPQWFQIADPVHDFVTAMKNNKVSSSGQTTNYEFAAGSKTDPDSRYFNGYSAMRLQTEAGSDVVYTRQFTDANLSGGQYKTLGDQEWAVTWDGNETGTPNSFLPGVIYGTSRCVKTSDAPTTTLAATVNPGTIGWTTIENSDALNDLTNIESYMSCFCKMTAVGLDGMITPVRDSSLAPWVFLNTYNSASECAYYCARGCTLRISDNLLIRPAIMGWAVE